MIWVFALLSLTVFEDVRAKEFDGKEFVCFTSDDSIYLLQLDLKMPHVEKKMEALKKLINNKSKQIKTLEGQNTLLNERLKVLSTYNANLEGQLDNSDVWYRNPWFWVATGTVLLTAEAVLLYSVLDNG